MSKTTSNASDLKTKWIEAYHKLEEIEESLSSDYFVNLADSLKGGGEGWYYEASSMTKITAAVETARGIIHRCKDEMKELGHTRITICMENLPDFVERCLLRPSWGYTPKHEESRMILKFMNNWDHYDLNKADLPEIRMIKYKEIMSQWRRDRSFNVERELASWLANFDDPNLERLAQFVKSREYNR